MKNLILLCTALTIFSCSDTKVSTEMPLEIPEEITVFGDDFDNFSKE